MVGRFLKYTLILQTLLGYVSCTPKNDTKSLNFNTTTSIFRLDTNDLMTHSYYLNDYRFFNKKDLSFSTYIKEKTLDIYQCNLSQPGQMPKIISLDSIILKPDSFGALLSTYIDNNKVAFFQEKRLGVYDLVNNNLLYEHPIDKHDSIDIYFQSEEFAPAHIHFIDSLNEIYLSVIHWIDKEDRAYDFDCTFHAKLNYKTNKLYLLPVKYPESYGNGELGLSLTTNTLYKGDSIIYSFSSEDNITIYDKSTNEIIKKQAKSIYENPIKLLEVDNIDKDKMAELHITNFTYDKILYNKWNKCYYRLYSLSQSLKNEDGFFNTSKDKQQGAIILDKNFKYIGEIILPDKDLRIFGVSKSGLFYHLNDTVLDNFFHYKTLNIEY